MPPIVVSYNEHHIVMGTVIQAVVERFYNDELWKLLEPLQLRNRLLEMCEEQMKLETARRYIDWRKAPTREEMIRIIKDGVMGYMKTLKAHRLLGPYAKAEVDLVAYVTDNLKHIHTPVGGRADLIIRREDTGVTILDGKNAARYKDGKGGLMTYTDPDQLRWYALLFFLSYHQMPNRLGFVYYRYPHGMPKVGADGKETGELEDGVEWVTFTKDDLKGLAQRAVNARTSMDKEKFAATPDPKTCRFCDYESVCSDRQGQKEQRRRNPNNKSPEEILDGAEGITTFTM